MSSPYVDHEFAQAEPNPDGNPLLEMLWRGKAYLILGLAVGLAIGALYHSRATPIYRSGSKLLLVKRQSEGPSSAKSATSYVEDYVSAQVELVRSPLLVRGAVEKAELASLATLRNSSDPVSAVIGGLRVQAEGSDRSNSNNVMSVSYDGPNREDCVAVLNAVIASYQDFLDETYANVNNQTFKLITTKADELRTNLRELEAEYETFRKSAPPLWKGSEGDNFYEERLASIEANRSQTQIRRSEAESRLATLKEAIKNRQDRRSLLAMIAGWATENSGDRLDSEALRLRREEMMLLQSYGPEHPKVRAVRMQLNFLRENRPETHLPAVDEKGDAVQLYIARLEREVEDLTRSEQSLTELFAQEQEAAKGLMQYDLADKRMRSEIQRSEQFYEGLLTQLQQLDIGKDFGGFHATLISPPTRGSLVEPNAAQIFTMAGVLGLLGGFGIAYLVRAADKNFRSPEEIRQRLGVSVVGCLPPLPRDSQAAELFGGLAPALCTIHRPMSRESEAFRSIRASLYFRLRGTDHKVIQVTSPTPGDGKSTVSANLAVSIAQSGKRVLLIDADLRRPTIHELFNLGEVPGLTSVLKETAELNDTVCETPVEHLAVLPSGPVPSNPAELLTSPVFSQLLDRVRDHYDVIIVDTPPLLAVSDPRSVAACVDGVFLTIRAGLTPRSKAEHASDQLRDIEANVLGVIVNSMDGDHLIKKYGYDGYRYGYQDYAEGGKRANASRSAKVDNGHSESSTKRRHTKRALTRISAWW